MLVLSISSPPGTFKTAILFLPKRTWVVTCNYTTSYHIKTQELDAHFWKFIVLLYTFWVFGFWMKPCNAHIYVKYTNIDLLLFEVNLQKWTSVQSYVQVVVDNNLTAISLCRLTVVQSKISLPFHTLASSKWLTVNKMSCFMTTAFQWTRTVVSSDQKSPVSIVRMNTEIINSHAKHVKY